MGMISNENLNEFLKEVREKAKGEDKLLEQFERCFLNTLETTVRMKEDGTVVRDHRGHPGDVAERLPRHRSVLFCFPAK